MALLPPFFLDTVVAIGFGDSPEALTFGATGFIYGTYVKSEGDSKRYRLALVTNRHVFEGQSVAWLRFNTEGDEPARQFRVTLLDDDASPIWTQHPDPEIDLAVLPVLASFLREEKIQFRFFQSDHHIMPLAAAHDQGLTEGDGVYILGFPMGFVGEARNYVIVRQGTVARIRDAMLRKSKVFLIDATIFPGSSGSPVVTKPEVASVQGTKAISSALLLGIVSAYVPYIDVAISSQTKRPRVTFEENSGLAEVVPVDYVQEVIDHALARKPKSTSGPSETASVPQVESPDA